MLREEKLPYKDVLLYKGKNLVEISKNLGISVADLRKDLKIPLTRVDLLTTIEELEEAYKKLPKGSKKYQAVIDIMDEFCFKKLEITCVDDYLQFYGIYNLAFIECKAKAIAGDKFNEACLCFLKEANYGDIYKVQHITSLAIEGSEAKKVAIKIYRQLVEVNLIKEEEDKRRLIEETEDIEKLAELHRRFNGEWELEKMILEKWDRRCIEEAEKVAVSRDFKKAKKIYNLCPIDKTRFCFPELKSKTFVFSVWRKICLEKVDIDPRILKQLLKEDYNDGESDYPVINPGAFEILDEICTLKIRASVTLEEVEKWLKIAPYQSMFNNKSDDEAEKRKKEIFSEKLAKATTVKEVKEIYDSPFADYDVKKMATRKFFELS